MKVLIFAAFVVVYILYLWTTTVLLTKFVRRKQKENFLQLELLIVIPNLFLFACLFIVGRFFNLYMVLVCIGASNIGLFLAFIIWSLLGSPKVPYKAVSGWAGYHFGVANVPVALALQVLSALMIVAYPIIVGIHFFSNDSPEAIQLFTLKSTTILILGSYLLVLPVAMGVLSTRFIDEDSRARFLITQFTGLIPYSLFISLLFWAFSLGDNTKAVALGDINFSFDPLLFTILMAFFVVFILLPYFIGIQQAKQMKHEYFGFKTGVLDRILEAIDLSTPNTVNGELEGIEQLLQAKYAELAEGEKTVALGVKFDAPDASKTLTRQEAPVYDWYKGARAFDKRFSYYDFLDTTYRRVISLKEKLIEEPDAAVDKETLKTHAAYFRNQKKELSEEHEKKGNASPVLWLSIIGILSPIISQVMTEVGKYLIAYYKAG